MWLSPSYRPIFQEQFGRESKIRAPAIRLTLDAEAEFVHQIPLTKNIACHREQIINDRSIVKALRETLQDRLNDLPSLGGNTGLVNPFDYIELEHQLFNFLVNWFAQECDGTIQTQGAGSR